MRVATLPLVARLRIPHRAAPSINRAASRTAVVGRRPLVAQAEPEGPAIRVDNADAVTDAEHELAGHRIDHPLVHANPEGEPARLNVHHARTPDSVPERTCLRVDYAHAVELFFIHSDILNLTADTRPASRFASRTAVRTDIDPLPVAVRLWDRDTAILL
jgi:hypothetical protein